MTAFTPGKWNFYSAVTGNIYVFTEDAYEGKGYPAAPIAEVFTDGIADPQANARLIACAPEMYLALIQAMRILKAVGTYLRFRKVSTDELYTVIETIDDLLDKTSGQQNEDE